MLSKRSTKKTNGLTTAAEEVKSATEPFPERPERHSEEEETQTFSREFFDGLLRRIDVNIAEKLDHLQADNLQRFEDLYHRQDDILKIMQEQISGVVQQIQSLERAHQPTSQQPVAINEDPDLDIRLTGVNTNGRRTTRRDSAYNRLSNFRGEIREGVLTMESDKHMEIIWSNKTVDGFLQFIEDMDRFVLMHNQPVANLYTHIAPDLQEVIAELLYIHKPHKYSSRHDVYQANIQDIYEMVQIHFAPRDLGHFNKLLYLSCKKYEVA